MAAEYLQQQSEMAELREYKAKIAEKIKENQEIIDSKTPTAEDMKQYNRLKDEEVWKRTKKMNLSWLHDQKWHDSWPELGSLSSYQAKLQKIKLKIPKWGPNIASVRYGSLNLATIPFQWLVL